MTRRLVLLAAFALGACASTQEGVLPIDAATKTDATGVTAADAMGATAADATPVVTPDAPVPPPIDAAVPPPIDAAVPPPIDAAVPPPIDAAVPPPIDAPAPIDAPPPIDAFVPPIDAPPPIDAGPPPDACIPLPVELCNRKDDNCNGQVDEGWVLDGECSLGVGACKRTGFVDCNTMGNGTVCNAEPGKPKEVDLCGNLVDDDCDGKTDEDFPQAGDLCTVGEGDCEATGLWECTEDQDAVECSAVPKPAGDELCGTFHDEDCDGNTDEGFPDVGHPCSVGMGRCAANGTVICDPNDLTMTKCSASPGTPKAETCNDEDDDCNGMTDDGTLPHVGDDCTAGTGVCGPGKKQCLDGELVCVPINMPGLELCDGKDNNCNGFTDEGWGLGSACDGDDFDFCRRGHKECDGSGFGTICVGDTPNTSEVCNNLDDDCDGDVDENWDFLNDPNHCGNCTTVCSSNHVDVRQCTGGACNPTCSSGYQSCDGNLVNGCESLRNTYSGALPSPTTTTASVKGDNPQAPWSTSGYGESSIRIQVREDYDGPENLHARFRLQNPDGVMMQLCVSAHHCGGGGMACSSLSGDQSVWASADETPWPLSCNDDTFDAYVEIRWISSERTACNWWTLTVYSESDPQDGYPNIDAD